MDKKMIYNIIDLPNKIKNKSQNLSFYENPHKTYTYEDNEILYKKRYTESLMCSKAIQLATKFYITSDYINFVEDNDINMYEIKEFTNYNFKKPFDDKPLLIQTSADERPSYSLLIDFIPKKIINDNYKKIEKYNLRYSLKTFWYGKKRNIVSDINHWLISGDIFHRIANKEKGCFYSMVSESIQTNSYPPRTELDMMGNNIKTVIYYYFAATYLKDILPIFETKDVKGRKPFVGNINTKQNIINLPTWEHKTITIKPNILRDMGYGKTDSSGKRLHDVRGHFRHYSNGKISWINSHKRGNAELGIITADGYKTNFKKGQIDI
jgi:hypothetical protein